MTAAEREELRQRLSWLRPLMQVELPVQLVRELIADCDRFEAENKNLREMLEGGCT